MNLFYQVFDKGMLTDGEGKEINFRNTILILTSNLASDVIQEMTGSGTEIPLDSVVGAIRPVLSKHFKPALLARMSIVPYVSLNPDAMKRIVELKMERVRKTLQENNRMAMDFTPALVEQVAARCTEVETGARNPHDRGRHAIEGPPGRGRRRILHHGLRGLTGAGPMIPKVP
jgi:type VI secretion system protein VasG